MPMLILIAILLLSPSVHAARLDGCEAPVRLGQSVLRRGDSIGRALRVIDRAKHQLRWVRGPSGTRWTLQRTGNNRRSYQLQFRDGRLIRLCQYRD